MSYGQQVRLKSCRNRPCSCETMRADPGAIVQSPKPDATTPVLSLLTWARTIWILTLLVGRACLPFLRCRGSGCGRLNPGPIWPCQVVARNHKQTKHAVHVRPCRELQPADRVLEYCGGDRHAVHVRRSLRLQPADRVLGHFGGD